MSEGIIALISLAIGGALGVLAIRIGWSLGPELSKRQPDPMRAAVEASEQMLPHVREALEKVERETAAQARREREAACPHRDLETVPAATYEDPTQVVLVCPDCGGARTYANDEAREWNAS